MNSIAYPIKDSLYLNITNRCTNECSFCIRNISRMFNDKYPLWLEKEPTSEEIIQAIGDPKKYKQIVFCGYGEPLIRLDIVKTVSKAIKGHTSVRIDTNGHGNIYWGRNILPELEGLIDSMSISLDAENAQKYDTLCHSLFGEKAYASVIAFAKEAKKYIPEVELSAVGLPKTNIKACKKIAKELGVKFRVRTYYKKEYVR